MIVTEIVNSILHPTLMYGSATLKWNSRQQSRMHAVEMSDVRGAWGRGKMGG